MRVCSFPFAASGRWLLLLTALSCVSCGANKGPALNPVKGQVLYKGKPMAGVVVTFHPKADDKPTSLRPVGQTGDDGGFTLMTGQSQGAPAGTYVLTFICPQESKAKRMGTEPPDTEDAFKGAYARREQSQIEVELKKGVNNLEAFNLK